MSDRKRKDLVALIREEGAAAARAGKHRDTCQYKDMDKYQWLNGYDSVAPIKRNETMSEYQQLEQLDRRILDTKEQLAKLEYSRARLQAELQQKIDDELMTLSGEA